MATASTATNEWRRFWPLPLVAALGYATSTLHIYGLGPFIEPLQQQFGWSRAHVSSGLTVAALLSGAFCIPIGMLVDRIGPRRIALIGVPLMCASVALLGTATGDEAGWRLLWVIVALGTLFVQATVWTSAVASRFEASRGLALAITLSGASVAATLYPLLGAWLIDAYGWRGGFVGLSMLWVVIVLPMLLLFFRGAQDEIRTTAASRNPEHALPGMSLAEGLRSAAFYKLLLAGGLFAFTVIGAVVHFVPILTSQGAAPLEAASIAALIGIFSVIGRIGTGFLLDRLPSHVVSGAAFLIPLPCCALLLLDGANPVSQVLAAAILGLTVGSEVDVIAYLAAKHFGLKSFGALYGALQMAIALGTALGPLAAGAVFDRFQGYDPFLTVMMILMATSALAMFSLREPTRTVVQSTILESHSS